MRQLILFVTLVVLGTMFIFGEIDANQNANDQSQTGNGGGGQSNGQGGNSVNGVTGDPDDPDFIPECTRCERLRLIGCRRNRCYYRCTRTCYDMNLTSYHEAVKFALPGSR